MHKDKLFDFRKLNTIRLLEDLEICQVGVEFRVSFQFIFRNEATPVDYPVVMREGQIGMVE